MSRLFYGLEDGIEHWITNRIEAHIFWCLDTTGRGSYTCWTSISQEMGFPTTNTGRVVIGCPTGGVLILLSQCDISSLLFLQIKLVLKLREAINYREQSEAYRIPEAHATYSKSKLVIVFRCHLRVKMKEEGFLHAKPVLGRNHIPT